MQVILSVLSVAGCASRSEAPELPKSITPGWRLESFGKKGAEWDGTYGGPGTAHVRIWAIHGSAEGLDRVQKWKAQANTVVVYSERYFAAVDWSGAERTEAGMLVRGLERALK